MRIINSSTDFLVFKKLFQQLLSSQSPIVIWQTPALGERVFAYSRLISFHTELKILKFLHSGEVNFSFSPGPIFVYSEEGQMIFKSQLTQSGELAHLDMPQEIKFLDDEEIYRLQQSVGVDLKEGLEIKHFVVDKNHLSDVMRVKSLGERTDHDREILNDELGFLSADDEDKIFADKRESPRARPKNQKFVSLQADGGEAGRYPLFDLSQGGMGLVTKVASSFTRGERIFIFGVDSKVLDDPLIGQIMSIRPLSENGNDFKVGVKFEEGQE